MFICTQELYDAVRKEVAKKSTMQCYQMKEWTFTNPAEKVHWDAMYSLYVADQYKWAMKMKELEGNKNSKCSIAEQL